MALAAVQTAMDLQERTIHPFFTKPLGTSTGETLNSLTYWSEVKDVAEEKPDTVLDAPHDALDCEQPDTGAQMAGKKRSRKPGSGKAKGDNASRPYKQSSLEAFARQTNNGPVDPENQSLDVDPNQTRRKRQKTASPEPPAGGAPEMDNEGLTDDLDWRRQLQIEAEKSGMRQVHQTSAVAPGATPTIPVSNQAVCTAGDSDDSVETRKDNLNDPDPNPFRDVSSTASTANKTPQKKNLLKINKDGKLIPPDSKAESELTTQKRRRGRKPTGAMVASTVTIIKYGSDAARRKTIGEEIDRIMNGAAVTQKKVVRTKPISKPSGPPKPTHPLFLGLRPGPKDKLMESKSAAAVPASPPRIQKKSAATPGKLKSESRRYQSSIPGPVFGSSRTKSIATQADLVGPLWPSKETAHVRNLDSDSSQLVSLTNTPCLLKARKMKSIAVGVPEDENIILRLAHQLTAKNFRAGTDQTLDFKPPKDVRLPERLLTTGPSIQEKVRPQLRTNGHKGNAFDGTQDAHPAIAALYRDIENTLTPFDLGKCESQSWVQKYAPDCTAHVLQPGKEPAVLRDWLNNLTVLAVGGGLEDLKKSVGGDDTRKPPKKKRKKAEDNFIVDSDEGEDEEMVEFSGVSRQQLADSGPIRPATSHRRAKWTRNKNVVLITGPHGCGKSAMVYAVAKELGFQIFEINSGSRRSGKDIQDKVGDMSENHLVSRKGAEDLSKLNGAPAEDTDSERHSKALQEDLESGRQGTMTSFFKSSAPKKGQPTAKVKANGARKAPNPTQATIPGTRAERKSQKQSLILFEEADVLFDEDQQFWNQVSKLASQSKRPIVITANNEALIPPGLPLAAILRLSPPPLDLATDYMLVLAGREGHVLERNAVSSLYESKNYDLRACITELNVWCQMSVGDRKGGLEWQYQRWPPGKDVDQHGHQLRVASKGTYFSGMGYLSHNVFEASETNGFDREEELMKEIWQNWGIGPEASDACGISEPSPDMSRLFSLEDLERLDALSESVSAADVYCRVDMPSYNKDWNQPTDPTLPPRPEKERLNYTIGAPVIQVDHLSDMTHLDTDLFVQTHLLVHRALGSHGGLYSEAQGKIRSTEDNYTQAILEDKRTMYKDRCFSREDFSEAFDILAYPPDTTSPLNTSYCLIPSSFDRTFRIVVEDLAPYVRSIVAHELLLEAQRIRLGNLLSEVGRSKRARTTRAARAALEGGRRETKRRERWFGNDLNRELAMGTAGKTWAGLGSGADDAEMSVTTESLAGTSELERGP